MTTTENRSDLISRKPDSVEQTFGLEPVEGLPKALGEALLDLSKLAATGLSARAKVSSFRGHCLGIAAPCHG
jgi:hypothetical protein